MRQALRGLLLGCALAWSAAQAEAQTNVTDVEYFYDSDPGFGAGTAVAVLAAPNIVAHTFTAGTGALSGGMHTLYVRSRDAGGKWSLTARLVLAKVQGMTDAHEASNIKGAEYFFDTDPGFGNGDPISIPTQGADIAGLTFTANVAPLSGGMHTLYVRTRDSLAGWSVTNKIVFAKVQGMNDPHVVSTITGAEYFFDSDPGLGAGTTIPVLSPNTDISGLVFNADVASLSGGMHTLYIRTRDAAGSWSHTARYYFAKV
ncbi:MAG TPA: hypothetical protein VGB67_06945, partial [Fibrella sp.]